MSSLLAKIRGKLYRWHKINSITRWHMGEFTVFLDNGQLFNIGRVLQEPRIGQRMKVYLDGTIDVTVWRKKDA